MYYSTVIYRGRVTGLSSTLYMKLLKLQETVRNETKGEKVSFESFPENSVGAAVTSRGRLFQRRLLITGNARLPTLKSGVRPGRIEASAGLGAVAKMRGLDKMLKDAFYISLEKSTYSDSLNDKLCSYYLCCGISATFCKLLLHTARTSHKLRAPKDCVPRCSSTPSTSPNAALDSTSCALSVK